MDKIIIETKSFEDIENKYILTHWQNEIELIKVIDGSMHCFINGKEYTISKGDICIINPEQLHHIYSSKEGDAKFQCLIIEPSLFTANQDIYKQYIEPILRDSKFSHMISSSNHSFTKEIVNLMDAIEDSEKIKVDGYELLQVAFLHMIFQKIYILYTKNIGYKVNYISADTITYRTIIEFIYKNYDQKLSLDDMARAGNISRNKCCTLFKKYTQHSPIEFLNLYRLEVSAELLKNTNESIAVIAYDCGFGQHSYYNRLFLRKYGITPKEYRSKVEKLDSCF